MSSENERPKRKVVIVDNHPSVRENLAALIQREPDLEVCGDAPDVPAALPFIHQYPPDLVILDVSSKRSQGLDSLKSLKAMHPEVRILALSLHDNKLFAERVLRAGAMGYITKQEATVNILSAIRNVLEGRLYFASRTAKAPPPVDRTNETRS